MNKRTEIEILRQQLELLTEDSKNTYQATNALSKNSKAMVLISKELFKRKCFAAMLFIAFCYLIKRFAIHGK